MVLNRNIALSDSGFIFNPGTGDSFTTNPMGLEIIRLLKENKSREEIAQDLLEKYSIEESTLEKDLSDFLMMLRNYQLLK